jgi:hypothetical protein
VVDEELAGVEEGVLTLGEDELGGLELPEPDEVVVVVGGCELVEGP